MDLKTTSVDSGAVDVNAVIANPSAVSKLAIDVAIIQKPQAIHWCIFSLFWLPILSWQDAESACCVCWPCNVICKLFALTVTINTGNQAINKKQINFFISNRIICHPLKFNHYLHLTLNLSNTLSACSSLPLPLSYYWKVPQHPNIKANPLSHGVRDVSRRESRFY